MLFIGNSFTTRNDLPAMLSAMVKAGEGIAVESEVISAGGASLRRHWNVGAADTITSKKWDYVVLQEHRTLPIKNSNRFHENVREFVPVVKESGGRMTENNRYVGPRLQGFGSHHADNRCADFLFPFIEEEPSVTARVVVWQPNHGLISTPVTRFRNTKSFCKVKGVVWYWKAKLP